LFVQRVCTERGKTQGQSTNRIRASSSPLHKLRRLSSISAGIHSSTTQGRPHRIASLGSGHNKDCLRYQPTESHHINSTDPTNHRLSTTVRKLPGTGQDQRGVTVEAAEEEDGRRRTAAGKQGGGRRGSNKTMLVLVGVASGKIGNSWSPSIPHAEAGSFASWILLEPYAIRGRRVKGGERVGVKSVDQALQLREHMA